MTAVNSPRLGVLLPHDERLDVPSLLAVAQAAEASGYSTISTGEVATFDAMALLGVIAASTREAELLTGVIPMTTRSVALAAMGFATLASTAPGRVLAGVGASSRTVVTGWHGREYGNPLDDVEAYVPALRRILAGGTRHDESTTRPGDFRLAGPTTEVPIVLAAMNPKMLKVAGRIADGVYLALCTPEDAASKVEVFRRAAGEAGRDESTLRVFASVYGNVGDPTVALPRLKRDLLGYATLPTHRAGFVEVFSRLDEIDVAWQEGRRADALALVGDEEVRKLVAMGSADEVARRLDEYRQAGVDTPVLLPVASERRDLAQVIATVVQVAGATSP
jgi:5,10-methylenetetrahydromethanopterin reductase